MLSTARVPPSRLATAIGKLRDWQVAIGLAVVGLASHFTGLNGGFQGDDQFQIIGNTPVHSIRNIFEFFGAGTFFNGDKLTGDYYRPMMSTTFSLVYSLFGAHPLPYHVVQLALVIAAAFVLYLIFKHFLRLWLALPLALVFLVHPLNSQVVYAIPTMQDALFFLFGVLALWSLIRFPDEDGLWFTIGALILAMLSKETGVVFLFLAIGYLVIFDRWLLLSFFKKLAVPFIVFMALRLHAVGAHHAYNAAPIDDVSLWGRILTIPSIILFYLTLLIFPAKLATAHYWQYPSFSLRHVLLPLLVDLLFVGFLAYGAWRLRGKKTRPQLRQYAFFLLWMGLGLAPVLQILPLDMTACETWAYTSVAGLFGALGVWASTLRFKKLRLPYDPVWLYVPLVLLVGVLAVRTAWRGLDYHTQYRLAQSDLRSEPHNYLALNNTAQYLIQHKDFKQAALYAQRSIDIYPVFSNYNNLGVAREQLGDYPGAILAYHRALALQEIAVVSENLGLIMLVYGKPAETAAYFKRALSYHPQNVKLLVYSALFDGTQGDHAGAKAAITAAAKYGQVPQPLYNALASGQPFALPLLGKTVVVQ